MLIIEEKVYRIFLSPIKEAERQSISVQLILPYNNQKINGLDNLIELLSIKGLSDVEMNEIISGIIKNPDII